MSCSILQGAARQKSVLLATYIDVLSVFLQYDCIHARLSRGIEGRQQHGLPWETVRRSGPQCSSAIDRPSAVCRLWQQCRPLRLGAKFLGAGKGTVRTDNPSATLFGCPRCHCGKSEPLSGTECYVGFQWLVCLCLLCRWHPLTRASYA